MQPAELHLCESNWLIPLFRSIPKTLFPSTEELDSTMSGNTKLGQFLKQHFQDGFFCLLEVPGMEGIAIRDVELNSGCDTELFLAGGLQSLPVIPDPSPQDLFV